MPRVARQSLGHLRFRFISFTIDRAAKKRPRNRIVATVADDSAVEREVSNGFQEGGRERERSESANGRLQKRGYMHARNAAAALNQKS